MRAVVIGGWGQTPAVHEVPEPGYCGPDQCIVRMDHAAIGNAEVWLSKGIDFEHVGDGFEFPHTPGFRGGGVVAEAGSDSGFRVGDRVMLDGLVACGRCRLCRRGLTNLCWDQYSIGYMSGHTGCMAELALLPARQLYRLPEELSFRDCVVVSDAAAAMSTFRRADMRAGDSVVIIGTGRVGTMGVAVAKSIGANPLIAIEAVESKHAFVRELGADYVLPTTPADEAAGLRAQLNDILGGPPSIVVEFVGTPESLALGAAISGPATRRVNFGVVRSACEIVFARDRHGRAHGSVRTVWGRSRADFKNAVNLVGRRGLARHAPITVFPMSQAAAAWEHAALPGERVAIHLSSNGKG